MKKSILISLLVIALLIITGCGKEKTKIMNCTMESTVNSETTMKNVYKVTYTGKYVDLVESTEKIKSSSLTALNAYKKTVEGIYEPYKNVEYYDYDITIDGNTLISKAKINYAKIDTDKMIKINSANKQLIKDGKIAIKTIKEVYEQLGAECK